MIVAKITQQQSDELKGVQFVPDNYFNPIEDVNGNWIISLEEVEQCSIEWVKKLPLIEYEPVEYEFPI